MPVHETTRMPTSRCRRGRLERGTASWVTVLLVLGLAAAAYAAVIFVPPAVLHYEVKQVVRDYGNQAIKNPDDERQVEAMVQKIRSLDSVAGVDEAGRPVRIPVVDLQQAGRPLGAVHVRPVAARGLRVPAHPRAPLAGPGRRARLPGGSDHGPLAGRLGSGKVTEEGGETT